MSVSYVIAVEGLDALRFMDDVPKSVKKAALRAVNKTIRDGRVMVSREIRKQVALTATYLGPSQGRIEAISASSTDKLEGRIRARTRPTSLARFTKDKPLVPGQRRRAQGIRLTVKPGVSRYLAKAFVVPLRAGVDGPLSNLGLAVRSDTKPAGAYKPKRLGKNLWLLYGPSISQVMYSARNSRGSGVAEELAPDLAVKLEAEFSRLIATDLN